MISSGSIDMVFIHDPLIYNTRSAFEIWPIVFQIVNFRSVMDLGCGIGNWLSVAKQKGITDVVGVDGDYVDSMLLAKHLTEHEFISHDLTLPLDLGRKFDLCLCLEVAEHLPEISSDVLINTLVRHSDLILFSAAIPGQGGQNHLNEKEPEFWIEKFATKGYHVYDPIRPLVWDNDLVDTWYKQNIFLFSKQPLDLPKPSFTYLVHPELFQIQLKKRIQYEKELERIKSGKASAGFYLKRFFKSLLH